MLFTASLFDVDWFSWFVTEVMLDAAIKATVLLAISAATAFVLRDKSAAVRHRIWCLGLTGACLIPLLSLMLPQWRLPVLPTASPAESSIAVPAIESNEPMATDLAANATQPWPTASTPLEMGMEPSLPSDAIMPSMESATTASLAAETDLSTAGAAITTVVETAPPVTTRDALAGAWLIGAVMVAVPFVLGLIVNLCLRVRSRRLSDAGWTRLLSELASRLDLTRTVTLLEGGCRVVPMTWGVLRPIVFLPDDTENWSDARRRFVLLHELAHVKRLDVLFQSIARLACAMYWFNPLAWYSLRKLRIERELACDDCVVASGERATDYASQLLEIARSYRPARLAVAVAMARSSKLEVRIVSMLDRARSHLPVGKPIGRCLLAAALVVVLGLSVIRLGERATVSAEPATANDVTGEENSTSEKTDREIPDDEKKDEKGIIRGRVLDESGKPVVGAKVSVILNSRSMISQEVEHKVAAQSTTDAHGRFSIKPPEYDEVSIGEIHSTWRTLTVIATADGFGPDWDSPIEDGGEMAFTLVKDTVPLEGRIVDLEGRPLSGVRVRVRSIATAKSDLDEWIAKAQNNPAALDQQLMYYADSNSEEMLKVARFPAKKTVGVTGLALFIEATTDRDGKFKLDGLGPDRWISMEIEGQKIVKTWASAVTRMMKPVNNPGFDPRFRSQQLYGANFDYVAEPSQLITGVIRDADTKEPLASVQIGYERYIGSIISGNGFVTAVTDDQGRYQLDGLPKPTDPKQKIRLRVLPSEDQPYFRTDVQVPKKGGLDPVEFDIELKSGAWITGQVTDKETGRPLRAHVLYYPLINNPNATKYANFNPSIGSLGYTDRYSTDENGNYRIPAIHESGVVLAVGFDGGDYQTAVGAAELGWNFDPQLRKKFVYHFSNPNWINTVRAVDVDPGAHETVANIELIPLSRQTIRVFDPQGKTVDDVKVLVGRRLNPFIASGGTRLKDRALSNSPIELFGLDIDGRRLLLLSKEEQKLGTAVVVEYGKTSEVTLQPLATITGRLLDGEGRPLASKHVWANIKKSEYPETETIRRSSIQANVQGGQTDDHGMFHLDAIIPGTRYEIMFMNSKLATTALIQPGQTVDLGDVQLK